jgi:hypothetical protein
MKEEKSSIYHSLQLARNAGRYEILVITAGNGNGWVFTEDCLKASLTLWNNAQSFVDHTWKGHSVRDLCGVLSDPAWDAEAGGIRAVFTPFGPAAVAAIQVAEDVLAHPELAGQVGFSADILFTAADRTIERIIKVNSADLVIDPARGGKWLRAIQTKGTTMNEALKLIPADPEDGAQAMQETSIQRVQTSGSTPPFVPLDLDLAWREEVDAATERLDMRSNACMLAAMLSGSKLPEAMQERIHADFKQRPFDELELERRIQTDRALLSSLTAAQAVRGGSMRNMFNSDDMLEAALFDLLGAPRRPELGALQPQRFSGIREAYIQMTGDWNMHGGYHGERVQLATTADFTGLVKNALNKLVAEHWKELGNAGYNWWESIVDVQHFETLNDITATLVGTVGTLPSVAERGEYTELAVGDSPETASFTKYGGYIPLTMELIDRDETRKLKAYPRELANAALRTLSGLVAAIFSANSGAGPSMADSGALFNATAVSTAGGHANLTTTALSASQWDVVAQAVYNQPMLIKNAAGYYGSGSKLAVEPRYCLVPRKLLKTAREAFINAWDVSDNKHAENLLKGAVVPLVVPEWTDDTDWAAVCDPRIAPAIIVGERFGILPEIYIADRETNPAVFMNDEHRLKVRFFVALCVADFRPLHKANVAG